MLNLKFSITLASCALEIINYKKEKKLQTFTKLLKQFGIKKDIEFIVWAPAKAGSNAGNHHTIKKVHCPKAEKEDSNINFGILEVSYKH